MPSAVVTLRTMRITGDTINAAYERHGEVYGVARAWSVSHHIDCWRRAEAAFDRGSLSDFERLYRDLKNGWQVFRRAAAPPPSPEATFDRLRALNPSLRSLRLSELSDDRAGECWLLINAISDLKPMKSAPSVVAISKFMHFWNPRLFVIVDDAVIWRVVLSRSWLKTLVRAEKERLRSFLPSPECPTSESCDLLDYLAVLNWSSRLVRDNPSIPERFVRYVCAIAGDPVGDLPLIEYEAAAVEWLLLGLAELPPEGVTVG